VAGLERALPRLAILREDRSFDDAIRHRRPRLSRSAVVPPILHSACNPHRRHVSIRSRGATAARPSRTSVAIAPSVSRHPQFDGSPIGKPGIAQLGGAEQSRPRGSVLRQSDGFELSRPQLSVRQRANGLPRHRTPAARASRGRAAGPGDDRRTSEAAMKRSPSCSR
jgi:hypothetical protein